MIGEEYHFGPKLDIGGRSLVFQDATGVYHEYSTKAARDCALGLDSMG